MSPTLQRPRHDPRRGSALACLSGLVLVGACAPTGSQGGDELPSVTSAQVEGPRTPSGRFAFASVALERGAAAFERGDHTAAVEELAEAAALAPSLRRAHYLLGRAQFAAGRPAEARAALETATSLKDGWAARLWIARTHLAAGGEAAEALARRELERARALAPDEPEVAAELAGLRAVPDDVDGGDS